MAQKSTFTCPGCGEEVSPNAKACPQCGACPKSGWNEEASELDGLDLPSEDFDYEKFTQEEFGEPAKPRGIQLVWKVTAAVLLVIFIIMTAYNLIFQ